MGDFVEVAGTAILLGLLLQVAAGTYGSLRRRVVEARRHRIALDLFRARAERELGILQFERQRREAAWDGYRKFRIERKVVEAKNICSFYLVPHDHMPIPPYHPGQFLTFLLRMPEHADPVVRCYSLSDSPTRSGYYRCTIKRLPPPPDKPDARGGLASSYFHSLEEGALLDVRAPSGNFFLDVNSVRPVVLVGAGVGITPLLSMLNMMCESESRREVWLFYGVRNRAEHPMFDHLKELAAAHETVRVVTCYSEPTLTCREGEHYDVKGHPSVELIRRVLPSNNYEYYVCGPPPMMEAVTKDLREWGVPDDDVHFEAFGPASVKRVVPADGVAESAKIVFMRANKSIEWSQADGSILDLAEKNGIRLNCGCRAGNCGTCETAIRDGRVSYVVETGFKPREGVCLVCVARPQGDLVLDA
jgi:hypothetical protein